MRPRSRANCAPVCMPLCSNCWGLSRRRKQKLVFGSGLRRDLSLRRRRELVAPAADAADAQVCIWIFCPHFFLSDPLMRGAAKDYEVLLLFGFLFTRDKLIINVHISLLTEKAAAAARTVIYSVVVNNDSWRTLDRWGWSRFKHAGSNDTTKRAVLLLPNQTKLLLLLHCSRVIRWNLVVDAEK